MKKTLLLYIIFFASGISSFSADNTTLPTKKRSHTINFEIHKKLFLVKSLFYTTLLLNPSYSYYFESPLKISAGPVLRIYPRYKVKVQMERINSSFEKMDYTLGVRLVAGYKLSFLDIYIPLGIEFALEGLNSSPINLITFSTGIERDFSLSERLLLSIGLTPEMCIYLAGKKAKKFFDTTLTIGLKYAL